MAGHRWGCLIHQRGDAKLLDITKRRELPPAALFISKTSLIVRPVAPLTAALLTAALLTAALLAATLFFTLALLTFTLLSLPILLLSALLASGICPVHLDFVLCP